MRSMPIMAALGIAACTTAVLPGAVQLAAQLTLESSATVQRVEWLFSSITGETVLPNTTNHGAGAGIVEIRTTDPATGLLRDAIGSACGGASLTTFGTPALGSPSFGIKVHSPPSVSAAVFLGAPAPRGGIQLTTSCHLYLDPLTLASAPILSGMINSAGVLQLAASVPLDAAILGAQLTIQAAAFVPNGPVGIGQPGYGLALSEGMQITVGF
jgi:hypothetical protein